MSTRDHEPPALTGERMAYLSSEYPAISHTFIFREIQVLRDLGLEIATVSVRPSAGVERMTAAERAEAQSTFVLQRAGVAGMLSAVLAEALGHPRRFLRMKARAWQVLTATRRPLKTLAYLVEAAVLNRWARSRRITHVHVHFANPAATVAMIGAAAGVFSYSMSVHGPDVFYDVPGGLLPQKLSHALFVRCISHFCRSQCARCLPFDCWSRLEVVRCGVDPGAFSPAATAASGESAGVPEILCVGRLVPAKGQHVLLQACSELQSRGVAFHLSFVGDGPDRGSLEHLAAELGLASAVTFAGVVGQGEIQAYYDRATVFCLPSFAEGVPVVLMEAMAKEIPVVSTRITGIPELVDDGVHGALITPSDSNGLADALARILSLAPGVRREMGRAGRRRVCETYDLAANCRVLAGVFDRRLARRRPAGVPTA